MRTSYCILRFASAYNIPHHHHQSNQLYHDFTVTQYLSVYLCIVALPVPMVLALCPLVDPSLGSICVQSCTSNLDCRGERLCCPYSCATQCMDPTFIPFYAIPRVCPAATLEGFLGSCDLTETPCDVNSDCDGEELCCSTRCGRVCQDATTSRVPCFTVREEISAALGSIVPPPGMYIPTCLSDGQFDPIQCSMSTGLCWCADVQSGRPLSSYSPHGTRPQCTSELIEDLYHNR